MHIYVKIQKGSETKVTVSPSHSILEVKTLLQDQVAIPVEQQKLVFQGRILSDEKRLEYYKIPDGSKLFLVLKKPDGSASSSVTSTPSVPSETETTPVFQESHRISPQTISVETSPESNHQIPPKTYAFKDDVTGFWESMRIFLKRHFTERDADKVLFEFRKDLEKQLSNMSLDDIERWAAKRLHATHGYYHQQML
ncbi:hypothetical protein CHS0354_039371 [Potamilus streckersoni]|uniref:Ubiquitin-like domain-containing protein n=1 Tax=Potamilus streckersoni TaxID=2493646 RepID=A0AAE0W5M2_9BIVA|nr:hypothetical protein CHS0354_039371 [Potamilus streckersoni]